MNASSLRVGLVVAAIAAVPLGTAAQASLAAPIAIEAPRLRVGPFSGVRTPFLLADGRLVVALSEANVIRVLGPDGALLQELGGTGSDIGRFQRLSAAWPRGEAIEAADPQLRRITRFEADGTVSAVQLGAEGYPSVVAGAVQDGWVSAGLAVQAVRPGRDDVLVVRYALEGTPRDEAYRVGGIDRMVLDMSGGGEVGGPHPLTPRAVVRVHGGEVYVAETLSPRIRVVSSDGSVERELAWNPGSVMDPAAALQVVREAAAVAIDDTDEIGRILLPEAQVPDRLSVFWDFLVDDAGLIWVRPYEPGLHAATLGGLGGPGSGSYATSPMGQGGEWRILSAEGVELGSVMVPEGLRPTQITRDALVGIRVDAEGTQSVHVHSLRRR